MASTTVDHLTDPASLPPPSCQVLVNLLSDRTGRLRANIGASPCTVTPNPTAQIDGLGWYYQLDSTSARAVTPGRLISASGGLLSSFPVNSSPSLAWPPLFASGVTGAHCLTGQPMRFAGFLTDTYGVQQNNTGGSVYTNFDVRSNGDVYPMGILSPFTYAPGLLFTLSNAVPLSGHPGYVAPWVTGTVYALGALVTSGTPSGITAVWQATAAGTSGSHGPVFLIPTSATPFPTNVPTWCDSSATGAVGSCTGVVWQFMYPVAAVPAAWVTGHAYATGATVTSNGGIWGAVAGATSGPYAPQPGLAPNPSIPTVWHDGSADGSSGGVAWNYLDAVETVEYLITQVDDEGRESSPSQPVSIQVWAHFKSVTITTTNLAWLTLPTPSFTGGGFRTVQIKFYATLQGGAEFFALPLLDAQGVNPNPVSGNGGSANVAYVDAFPDTIIDQGNVAPGFGENDPPLPASLIGIFQNRVILNVTGLGSPNAGTFTGNILQISNSNSGTQFAAVQQINPDGTIRSSDGGTLLISSDQGNPINGFASFGAYYLIACRRGLFALQGTDFNDFETREVHDRGCIAPDSMVRCDNHVALLTDDGFYVCSYIYRFIIEKFSKPIEPDLQTLSATPIGYTQMEACKAAFVNNCYYAGIGSILYRYDFDVQGWTLLQLFNPGATITAVVAVQQTDIPRFLCVGTSDNHIYIIDEYTFPQAVSGIKYRTRVIQPDPADRDAAGNTAHTLHKRAVRVLVRGVGTLSGTNTLTVNFDGQSLTTPLINSFLALPAETIQGILIGQGFPAYVQGRYIDVELDLNASGLIISSVEIQSVSIG